MSSGLEPLAKTGLRRKVCGAPYLWALEGDRWGFVLSVTTHNPPPKQKVQYRGRKQFLLDSVIANPDISQPRELRF